MLLEGETATCQLEPWKVNWRLLVIILVVVDSIQSLKKVTKNDGSVSRTQEDIEKYVQYLYS